MAVAIGLLVVGVGSYTAQAASGKAAQQSGLINGLGTQNVLKITRPALSNKLEEARISYAALKDREQRLVQQEQRDNAARERFGAWGPDLVAAAALYGQDPEEMYRVMMCESRGDAYADNGVCKGLFQFNPGTWAGTPFGGFDINDGQAQIYGAAWMFSQGRKGEWVCQ